MENNEKPSFLRNHIDTVAIIGVNLAAIAILVTMLVSNTHRIDAANARSDALYSELISIQKDGNDRWNEINANLIDIQQDNYERFNEINEKIYGIWKHLDYEKGVKN